jgi:hypothetical protein
MRHAALLALYIGALRDRATAAADRTKMTPVPSRSRGPANARTSRSRAEQVDVNRRPERLLVLIPEDRPIAGDAGVRDQQIDARRLLRRGGHRLLVSDIESHRDDSRGIGKRRK